jgi:hypothetical protein
VLQLRRVRGVLAGGHWGVQLPHVAGGAGQEELLRRGQHAQGLHARAAAAARAVH